MWVALEGDTCDQTCDANEWGYDCEGCCHCGEGGKCDVSSGACQGGGGRCSECWTGFPTCQEREGSCRVQTHTCAANAISFTDYDRCGEPLVRCQCLAGYTGDGHNQCDGRPLSSFLTSQQRFLTAIASSCIISRTLL